MIQSAPASLPVQLALSVLGGVLYFLGFVGFGISPLIWICFVPVLFAIRGVGQRRAWLLGAVFGLVTNLGGYYWVIRLLSDFTTLSAPLAVLGYALLCLYQGSLLAVVVWAVARARERLGIAPMWSLAVAFPALELAYPLVFPSYIGNSQYLFLPITQIVELTGMLGLTVLISLVNGAVFEVVEARREHRRPLTRRCATAVVCFALCLVYGLLRIPAVDAEIESARRMKVALIQANLGSRDKWTMASEFIRRHQAMTRDVIREHPELELIVWPESAYNRTISREEKNLSSTVMSGIERPVLFGALTVGEGQGGTREAYNSAVLTSSTGEILSIYDKVVLLAFGEKLPLSETFPQIKELFPRTSFFTPGRSFSHLQLGDIALLPMVCYEDIIPGLVRKLWKESGPADVLVNLTNDSWYGDTHEPMLHLALASFRSVETRRALIRSTNTGISAVVDPVGRITSRTGQWTQETLLADVPLIEHGRSPLNLWLGDTVGWVALLLAAVGFFKSRKRPSDLKLPRQRTR